MRAATTCLFLVFAAACGDNAAPGPDPDYCYGVGIPEDTVTAELDLLLVVGNAGSMGEEQAALAEWAGALVDGLESLEGGLPDVHIAVMSDDTGGLLVPAGCPALTDGKSFIGDELLDVESGSRQFNYTGRLADQLSCMLEVGTAGGDRTRPLASLARALEDDDSGFRRPAASLAIAVVSDRDDASPDDARAYADRVRATAASTSSFVVSSIVSGGREGCTLEGFTEAAPAPRLADFAAALGSEEAGESLCGEPPLLDALTAALVDLPAGMCVLDSAVRPLDCQVADVRTSASGVREELPIPSCDRAGPPCFEIVTAPASCPDTDSHEHLRIERAGQPPPDDSYVSAHCLLTSECP